MVIYPPNSRATFDQPKWARQDSTRTEPVQYEVIEQAEQYSFHTSEMDSNTFEASREVSDVVIEAARDKAQVKLIMANTESVCAWRKLAQSQ